MVTTAYINRVATAVPPHDVHRAFLSFAESMLRDPREIGLVRRMAAKAGIEHRYSFLAPGADPAGETVDADGFYRRGRFPSTGARMRLFGERAPVLAADTVERLQLGPERNGITHSQEP